MKTALISDIHGNFEALKAVLKEIDRLKVDRIFCVGDVVGYYSQVNDCCQEYANVMSLVSWEITIGTWQGVVFVLVPRV